MRYLLTAGDQYFGWNPGMTEEGFNQICHAARILLPKIPRPSQVIVGIGRRFQETYSAIDNHYAIDDIPVLYSPFAGTPEGRIRGENRLVALEFATVLPTDYIGFNTPNIFDAWEFILSLEPNALILGDIQLLGALGDNNISLGGQLYELDLATQDVRVIAEDSATIL